VPIYDRLCESCGWRREDCLEPVEPPVRVCDDCGQPTVRAWFTKASNVIGDEMDHVQVNGTNVPIRFRSKQERKRFLKAHGWREAGEHAPPAGTDKSKLTQSWAAVSAETLESAKVLLERVGSQGSGWRDPDQAPIGITSPEGLMRYMNDVRVAENHGQFGFKDR
jgi:hypothetical protein